MAEFNSINPTIVMPDDSILLPEIKMNPGSKYWIDSKWTQDGKEESGHWEIKNDNIEGAYMLWRKENWEQLFDPFKVKITSLTISRMQ